MIVMAVKNHDNKDTQYEGGFVLFIFLLIFFM